MLLSVSPHLGPCVRCGGPDDCMRVTVESGVERASPVAAAGAIRSVDTSSWFPVGCSPYTTSKGGGGSS